jgi:hypothetical protein
MKRSNVLLAAVLAVAVATSAILGACSGGGGGGTAAQQPAPKVQLSGTIGSGYSHAKGSYGKSYIAAPPPALIDAVVAIPMTRGALDARNMTSSVPGMIGLDGKFNLALPMDQDWLLVLINSAGTSTTRFVGSLALSAGSESILNLPATASTLSSLNLGTITRPGVSGDAITSSATVTAADFGMSANQFTAFANSNDVFKNAKNIINNYNTTTGVWYQLRPDFTWVADYTTINGAFSGTAPWAFHSYNFQMDTNATNLTVQNLCTNGTATVAVAWTPPVGKTINTVGGFYTYSTGNPITNSAAVCEAYSSDGVAANRATGGGFYATDAYWGPYGTLSYSVQAWFLAPIESGDWTWSEGGVVKATFDPSVSTPVHTDGVRSLGYVPSIKVTVDTGAAGGVITAVDVDWYYFDGSTYQPVTTAADFAVMQHLMDGYEIIFDATSRHSSFRFTDWTTASQRHLDLTTTAADNDWTYADNVALNAFLPTDAQAVGVFYSSGGIGRYFFARAPM